MDIYEFYESEQKKHPPEEMALPESEMKTKQKLKSKIKNLLLCSIKAMFLWGLKETENIPTEKIDLLRTTIKKELSKNCYNSDIRILIKPYLIDCSTSYDSFSYKPKKKFSDLDYCEFQKKTNCTLWISLCPSIKNSFRLHIWDNDNINCGRLEKKLLKETLYELDVIKKVKEDPLGVCELVEIDINKLKNS